MDVRKDVSEFLASRRAKIQPQDVGLPNFGAHRRVPGLRREEVALLAGVSVDYYTRIERGRLDGVSESVLDAVIRVLQLDDVEQAYLRNLAGLANMRKVRAPKAKPLTARPGLQRVIDAMENTPAYIRNGRLDVIAQNAMAKALFSPCVDANGNPENVARFFFLNPAARDFFVDWDSLAEDTVGVLRNEAGRSPFDKNLTDLIGELSTRSELFRVLWANHNVRKHVMGVKRFNHPSVGVVEVHFESIPLVNDEGLTLLTYSAEKGSASEDALKLLGIQAAGAGVTA